LILDTSAVVATLLKEQSSTELIEKILSERDVGIGCPTLAETAIVLSARLRKDARGLLSRFIAEASVVVVPFGEPHFSTAVDAWLRFGKGRHPASLNFGDCLSYATARVADRALLCTGEDFTKTDLELA
jgi:ribonuclease VapC